MKLLIRLTSIKYNGTIGRNWSFNLDFGKSEFPFDAEIKSGVPRQFNKPVYFETPPNKKRQRIVLTVKATERDKAFPESGTRSTTFNVDLTSTQPQKFSISVDVKEDRGPKVKTSATGHLDLYFEATVAGDDDACMGIGDVKFEILEKMNLTAKDYAYAEQQSAGMQVYGATFVVGGAEIYYCLYKSNDEWRIGVVYAGKEIRWGVNTKRFRDIVFPGSTRKATVNCNTVDEMLKDIDFHIREKSVGAGPEKADETIIGGLFVPSPGAGKKPRWHMREAVIAHERVHIKEYSDILQKSWPAYQKQINDYVVGSALTMTREEADKAAADFVGKMGRDLADCLDAAGEAGPRRVEVDALKEILRKLISFKDVECGPIFNSRAASRKTTAKKKNGAKKKSVVKKSSVRKKAVVAKKKKRK